jgi:hypothetical protein
VLLIIIASYVFTRGSEANPESVTPGPPAVSEPPTSPVSTPPVAVPVEPEPSPEPVAAPPQGGVALEIQAQEKTWIQVTSDGNNMPGELLEPGMMRKFTAEMSLSLTVGNAAGLTMKLNDQAVKPLGKSGQVREIVITPENLKDFTG